MTQISSLRSAANIARAIGVTLVVCALLAGFVATAATANPRAGIIVTGTTPPLVTALDDPIFQGPQKTQAYALMASKTGATYTRLMVSWKSIAPVNLPPSGFHPVDPASPYYRWTNLDASVAAAAAAGISPILDIVNPPKWAYAVKPMGLIAGTPKIKQLGAFATALASRYNGSVHVYSVWNEPNFNRNLYPQSPSTYRSMVNAVADSVHAVDPSNLVAAGELAPFKHQSKNSDKNNVIAPLAWMRQMLCLSKGATPQKTCNTPAKFDIWAHHPYSDKGPFGKASTDGGVELGDLPAMDVLLRWAAHLGTISSEQPPQFWVTEVGWSTNPPNKNGVPMDLETRWVAETLYQMWKSGVTLGTWFLLQDEPLSTPFQSGLYRYSASVSRAKAKPLLSPFRFPFVAYLKSHGKVQIWGRDATSDTQDVLIQRRAGSKGPWHTVATVRSNEFGIFKANLSIGAKKAHWLRAVAPGSGQSTAFSLSVPKDENRIVNPFPLNT